MQTTKENNTNWASPLTNDKAKNCSVISNNSQPAAKGIKGIKYTSLSFIINTGKQKTALLAMLDVY